MRLNFTELEKCTFIQSIPTTQYAVFRIIVPDLEKEKKSSNWHHLETFHSDTAACKCKKNYYTVRFPPALTIMYVHTLKHIYLLNDKGARIVVINVSYNQPSIVKAAILLEEIFIHSEKNNVFRFLQCYCERTEPSGKKLNTFPCRTAPCVWCIPILKINRS